MQKYKDPITEDLIFWTAQYVTSAREALVFKRDRNTQDQILINFIGSSGMLPNRGSKMKVTYCFGSDGVWHGISMTAVDPGAYD